MKGGNKMYKSTNEAFEELREASEPLVKWLRENGCPHDSVTVEWSMIKFKGERMGLPVEKPDALLTECKVCGKRIVLKPFDICVDCDEKEVIDD